MPRKKENKSKCKGVSFVNGKWIYRCRKTGEEDYQIFASKEEAENYFYVKQFSKTFMLNRPHSSHSYIEQLSL